MAMLATQNTGHGEAELGGTLGKDCFMVVSVEISFVMRTA